MPKKHTLPTQPGEDFFTTLRERFTHAQAMDKKDREEAQEDARFAAGDQWDPAVKKARKKRPCLTENRLGPSIAQVVNDGRQNKPSITTSPLDGGTEETAEYFQGRIRQIEYDCDADIAYDTARDQQVTTGRGFIRVTTRYKKGKSGAQEIAIEPIPNQFSVYWDPGAKKYDLSDATWKLVIDRITKSEHERRFGKQTKASKNGFFLDSDNPAPGWMGLSGGDLVQVADYYVMDEDEDGNPCCMIYATNGVEVLDETLWIGTSIPIVPQWGQQAVVDDMKQNRSLIRQSKVPQRLVNLYVSNIAEQISQMPKTPFLAAEGQILGRESEWEMINEVQKAVVQYKTRSAEGDVVGAPQRVLNEPPIEALVRGYLQAVDAVKATMGIFDSSLGANKDDTSGVAIARRQKESDVTNFHFSDNEARSRKHLGRILLEIIPLVDGDEPTKKPIRHEDGKTQLVEINQPILDKKRNKVVHHDMTAIGDYQVAVSTGPSYTSQRQEENERQGEFIKAAPDLMWVLGDLYFGSSDGPGAKQMAERMEKAISLKTPGLIEDQGDDPAKAMQKVQQQAAQLHQMNDQLTQQLHVMSQQLESKQAEADAKFKSEALRSWTQIRVAEINAKLRDGIAAADRVAATEEQMFGAAHDVGMAAMDHAHQVLQAQQQQEGAAASAEQSNDHASQQAQQAQQAQMEQQQAQQQAEGQAEPEAA